MLLLRSPAVCRPVVALLVLPAVLLATAACDSDSPATPDTTDPVTARELPSSLLPGDTRAVLRLDVAELTTGDDNAPLERLLSDADPRIDPAVRALFAAFAASMEGLTLGAVERAWVAITEDPRAGRLLLAQLGEPTLQGAVKAALGPVEAYRGQSIQQLPGGSRQLVLLPGGVLAVGAPALVRGAIDAHSDGARPVANSALAPYLPELEGPLSFVIGGPAAYGDAPDEDALRLDRARAISGTLQLADEQLSVSLRLHMDRAAEFVATFNEHTKGEGTQLALEGDAVTLRVEDAPLAPTGDAALRSRWLLKQLSHGMNTVSYAAQVAAGSQPPWLHFAVTEAPNSIFINFEFKDEAQVAAFQRDHLPAGFELMPLRILEDDEPSYFLVLNIYNSGGGLVSGARAEWSVFVKDPVDGHVRFMVVQAAAADLSADSVNLLTQGEPVLHTLEDEHIVSYVGVETDDGEQTYWRSAIRWPLDEAPRVRTTREFVAANDLIYWGNGVADRGLYNGTVYNRDLALVEDSQIEIEDHTPWAAYVKPRPTHAYVYLNPLEMVVSPWWNLDADYLDVTEEHHQALVDFKDGFYPGIVERLAAAALRGEEDALSGFRLGEEVPSAFFHFRVRDAAALEQRLALADGHHLAPLRVVETDAAPAHYLTLQISRETDDARGTRATWFAYVRDGSGEARRLALAAASAELAIDPVDVLRLPALVEYAVADDGLRTRIEAPQFTFSASAAAGAGQSVPPGLDWVETGDRLCWSNQVCSRRFYGGSAMEAPLSRLEPSAVTVEQLSTPWDDLLDTAPTHVVLSSAPQLYAETPWYNVRP